MPHSFRETPNDEQFVGLFVMHVHSPLRIHFGRIRSLNPTRQRGVDQFRPESIFQLDRQKGVADIQRQTPDQPRRGAHAEESCLQTFRPALPA